MSNRTLAIFDFDGTITYKDSFIAFLIFCNGKLKTYGIFLLLLPQVILYKLKLYNNQKLKELVLKCHFRGKKYPELSKKALSFLPCLDRLCRESMVQRLKFHKEQNHEIVILTASCRLWLEHWCLSKGYSLICSELEIDTLDKITGKLKGGNCHGKEKVRRLKEVYDLTEFESVFAYGNEPSDRYYMDLADHKEYL